MYSKVRAPKTVVSDNWKRIERLKITEIDFETTGRQWDVLYLPAPCLVDMHLHLYIPGIKEFFASMNERGSFFYNYAPMLHTFKDADYKINPRAT